MGGFRLITHHSYPIGQGINAYIDSYFSTVQYSPFDNTISIVQSLGKNALCAKSDIKSALRLLPIYPSSFDLLGIQLNEISISIKCFQWGYHKTVHILKKIPPS